MNKLRTKIEASILRLEASHRGGGVEITLKPFGRNLIITCKNRIFILVSKPNVVVLIIAVIVFIQ
jgi:hypothetical protein